MPTFELLGLAFNRDTEDTDVTDVDRERGSAKVGAGVDTSLCRSNN